MSDDQFEDNHLTKDQIQQLSKKERLERMEATLDYLLIEESGMSATEAAGINFQRQIQEIRMRIAELQQQVWEESSNGGRMQQRINRGYPYIW